MNLRQAGCALLLNLMRLVKKVPAVISAGRGSFPRFEAIIAMVILMSSSGVERGSHARVGVLRLKPIACNRKVE